MVASTDLLGRTVAGKFRIEALVGSGAMGDVYRARHAVLDSVIALKIMRADVSRHPEFRERFYREAKAASRLEHPNSVRVLDFGEEPDGLVYLAMEFLAGRDLLTLLREEWPLSDERVVDIVSQTLGAVAVAHGLGIVHRDLKPENIMVASNADDDGHVRDHVKVCDFGIAKLSDPRAFQSAASGKALTATGALIGTPEYMSPEQSRGDPLDARSDLYSVGVILYQMLAGKVPFTAENALGVLLKQVTDEPVPPSEVRSGVSPALEAVCLRALKKRPDERFQSAKQMRAELRAAIGIRGTAGSELDSGGRLPSSATSGRELAPSELASAPTLAEGQFAPKETSVGAELAAREPRHGSRTVVAAVAAVALAVGATGFVLLASPTRQETDARRVERDKPHVVHSASAREHTGGASKRPTAHAGRARATDDPAAGAADEPASGAEADAAAEGEADASPSSTGALARGSDAGLARDAGARGALRGGATPAASSRSGARPTGATSPAAASSDAPIEPTTAYDPSGAYVQLGRLTTERVREDVVSGRLAAVVPQLSDCYRSELRMRGSPDAGGAEVSMSIDASGRVQAVVNAPKHPEFARCAQHVLGAQTIPTSALDGEGATATQWLTLRP